MPQRPERRCYAANKGLNALVLWAAAGRVRGSTSQASERHLARSCATKVSRQNTPCVQAGQPLQLPGDWVTVPRCSRTMAMNLAASAPDRACVPYMQLCLNLTCFRLRHCNPVCRLGSPYEGRILKQQPLGKGLNALVL